MHAFQSFFELIPILVGAIFAAVGFFSLKNFLALRKKGSRVAGEVTGIEKYVSTTGSGSDRSSSVMYCPVVSYTFEGQAREVRGLSVNHLRHRLGQKVEILVRQEENGGNIEASINDSLNVGLGLLFLGLGLGAIGFGATLKTASVLLAVPTVALVFAAGFVVDRLLQRTAALGGASEPAQPRGENYRLITDSKEFDQEVVLHKKVGYVIALVALLGGLWVTYAGLSQLSAQELTVLTSAPLDLLKSSATKKPALLAGVGVFFSAAGVYSFVFQMIQYRFLSRG